MALSNRQRWAYRDTVDVYRISSYEKDSNQSVKQPAYSSSPVVSGLVCRIQTTTFRNGVREPLGRSQTDNFETEDTLHCELSTDLRDADIVVVTTSGSPVYGKPFKVIGKGEGRIGRANYNHVHIRLMDVKPKAIP
jgi:hypothetical protein